MIPKLSRVSGFLPPGIHPANWADVQEAFGQSPKRKLLLDGLLKACIALRVAGVQYLYLDGSFVSAKRNPGDWDACYSGKGVDSSKMDPVLLDYTNRREAQKKKYQGEVFVAEADATGLREPYLSFFQKDKNTGRPKGLLCIDLGTLP